MDKKRIYDEMSELEIKLSYKFNKISLLAEAMKSVKIEVPDSGKNHREYSNEVLATVGDAILKAVIADRLFSDTPNITKGKLTTIKKCLENNKTLHGVDCGEGIINYAFNEKHFYNDPNVPGQEKVVSNGHDAYVEAIVGAIYYDSNFEITKQWINVYLYPLLEKYKVEK